MRDDTLIVGQGLAGSLLAWQLLRRGLPVRLVDAGGDNASRTAAGLVTPVTGKRWGMPADIETWLAEARRCYRQLERQFGRRFWIERPRLRLYLDPADRELARRRRRDPAYAPFLGDEIETAGDGLRAPWGGIWLRQTAHLETEALLDHLRQWFQQQGILHPQRLDPATLEPGNPVRWEGLEAHRVVFCDGWQVIHNPWFDWLPWQPSRGQILTVTADPPLPSFPVHCGVWLQPRDGGRWRLGASYRWQPLTTAVREEETADLCRRFRQCFQSPPAIEITDVRAGIRPNTLDHRPIAGRHPRHPQLLVCNGLGSKGSLLAPRLCRLLAEHLCHGVPLPAAIDLRRHHDRPPH